jgi:hypothetical protein
MASKTARAAQSAQAQQRSGARPTQSAQAGRAQEGPGVRPTQSAQAAQAQEGPGVRPTQSAQAGRAQLGPGVRPTQSAQAGRAQEGPGVRPTQSAQAGRAQEGPGVRPTQSAQTQRGPESVLKRRTRTKRRQAELTAGWARRTGVTVQRIKLGSRTRQVVMSRSRGVQIGEHNRQLNQFRYRIVQPRVSLQRLLDGHPARQQALARLAANPNSSFANYLFRRRLPTEPSLSRGRVRFAETAGPQAVRVAARIDDRGAIVVDRSKGVQVGNWNTQRNRFSYRVQQDLSLAAILRSRPDLARSLATAIRHPAAQRSFTRRLTGAYGASGRLPNNLATQYRGAAGLTVTHASGVQLGSGTRVDRVAVDIQGGMVLTGWGSARQVARGLPSRGDDPSQGPV